MPRFVVWTRRAPLKLVGRGWPKGYGLAGLGKAGSPNFDASMGTFG